MAMASYPEILSIILCFLFICYTKWRSIRRECSSIPKFPVIGMLPALLQNSHRIHDFATDALKENGGTFDFVGPKFANMDMLLTSDTANIHYIMSKNFSNFPKGPEFNMIFDILGDGIFNADSELWENERKIAMSLINRNEFQSFVARTSWNKVVNGLIPVLENFAESGKEEDLQELFQRFTFDCTCILVLGHDPVSLSIDLPDCVCEKAFNDAEEAILYRHIFPESFWKLQKWLQIGKENKLRKAQETVHLFIARCILSKREELKRPTTRMGEKKEEDCDLLTAYIESCDEGKIGHGNFDKFLRDNLLNLIFAGRDTISASLTWFFWLLAENPSVEKKILEEIVMTLNPGKEESKKLDFSNIEEVKKLVYLNGALCEALRLYPPVPTNHKASLEPDILPSGNIIKRNTRILLCFYAMGRMETIWGKDCLKFKPERWITEQGGIKHEPSFKFTAFNAGPRTCLGKNMSFVQMKIVAVSIIYKYSIQVAEDHPVCPSNSVILQMKHGLKVRIIKRDV